MLSAEAFPIITTYIGSAVALVLGWFRLGLWVPREWVQQHERGMLHPWQRALPLVGLPVSVGVVFASAAVLLGDGAPRIVAVGFAGGLLVVGAYVLCRTPWWAKPRWLRSRHTPDEARRDSGLGYSVLWALLIVDTVVMMGWLIVASHEALVVLAACIVGLGGFVRAWSNTRTRT